MRGVSGTLGLFVVLGIALLASSEVSGAQINQPPPPSPTPGWDTSANHPGDPNYHVQTYPIAFVKAPLAPETLEWTCRDFDTVDHSAECTNDNQASCTDYVDSQNHAHDKQWIQRRHGAEHNAHLGSDVVSATNPGVGNELWIYLPPNGQVKKLFPLPIHQTQGKIDFAPSVGSVVEPSLSEDGTKIYFSYFQDATEAAGTNLKDSETVPLSGADMYAIDIGPLLSSPLWDPSMLHVTRLTTRSYITGTHQQLPSDRDKDAMNPTMAATPAAATAYGTVYLHPTEVRTRTGLHLAYVSNKRRLDNSNDRMRVSNYNLNLHLAWLNPDGTLGPEDSQFEYYTTTSALSPTPLREGLAFSYQATTDDNRYWHIQKLDSEGRWSPLIGYGHGDQLFHLGTFCVSDVDGFPGGETHDYFVALKYYNINNESFGSLWKQDLSILGKNSYGNASGASILVPRQDGATELTLAPVSLSHDSPSPYDIANGKYYGKFTTPRCGGVDELYFAYSPTGADNKVPDYECNRAIYRSRIGFRDSLQPWTVNAPAGPNGHSTVIKRTNDDFNLLWPLPILGWVTRTNGDSQQRYKLNPVTRRTPDVAPGEPFAI
ncbi:MAG TPA: hypothetical protein VFO11_11055, partial [Candidatus Polarisedimenticolaceae bacterium]|nr:hypothetical protein [Candidatus Polarisedimenticolaceae bacterium]